LLQPNSTLNYQTTTNIYGGSPPFPTFRASKVTKERKWTHYLWEFLLFLTGSVASLAENIREHIVKAIAKNNISGIQHDWKT